MKKQNKQNGITLIALVITIIILIILAGITISALSGSELFERAQQTEKTTTIAQAAEELKIKIYEVQIQKNGAATLQDFVDCLEEDEENEYVVFLGEVANVSGVTEVGNAAEIYVYYKGYTFKITSELTVEFDENVLFMNAAMEYKGYENGKLKVAINIVSENGKIKNIKIGELNLDVNANNQETFTIDNVLVEANKEYELEVELTNGTKATKTVKYVDTEAPKVIMNIPTKQFTNSGTATAEVTINDRTEVNLANCKWIINSTSDEIGTDSSLYTDGTFENTNQTISKELTAGGNYYFHVLATDVVGNAKEYISESINLKVSVTYLNTNHFGLKTSYGDRYATVLVLVEF